MLNYLQFKLEAFVAWIKEKMIVMRVNDDGSKVVRSVFTPFTQKRNKVLLLINIMRWVGVSIKVTLFLEPVFKISKLFESGAECH